MRNNTHFNFFRTFRYKKISNNEFHVQKRYGFWEWVTFTKTSHEDLAKAMVREAYKLNTK